MPTMTPAAAKKAAAALKPAERLAILEKIVNSAEDDGNGDFAYYFDEFYIEFPGYDGSCSLYKRSCQNHINDHANVVAAYLAGVAEFVIEPFEDDASFNAALRKAVEDAVKQDYDNMSSDELEDSHSRLRKILKAAPKKAAATKPTRKPRKKASK